LSVQYPRLSTSEAITELGSRFRESAHDRRVYAVIGSYSAIEKFAQKARALCEQNGFGDASRQVRFSNLNEALLSHLEAEDQLSAALDLGERLREKQLTRLMGDSWNAWLSSQMEQTHGLVLAGFELFYAYLDSNALALVRQYAINGKHICLLIPGTERDGQVWIFDETPEFRRQVGGLIPQWTYILDDN
jgi:hypothetical protein